jgi:hypothetical protein
MTIDKEVQLSKDIFLSYKSNDRQTFTDNLIEDREFFFGEQYKEEVKNQFESEGRMAAPVNEVLPAIDLIVQQLTENSPRFHAVAREDSDNKVAYYISRLYDWIWYISKGETRIEKFSRDYIGTGMGVLFVYPDFQADNGRGEIKIIDIDPLYVYFDPQSKEPDGSDSTHILISELISEEIIKLYYPQIDITTLVPEAGNEYSRQRGQTQGTTQFSDKEGRIQFFRYIDRYTKTIQRKINIYDPNSNIDITFEKQEDFEEYTKKPAFIITRFGKEEYISEDAQVAQLMSIYQSTGGEYQLIQDPQTGQPQIVPGIANPGANPSTTTRLKLITKGNLIALGVYQVSQTQQQRIQRVLSIGDNLIDNEILSISEHPVIACMLHHNRNPYPCGDIRVVKPLQEQLNILDSRIQEYLKLITKLRVFTTKGGGLKKQLEKDPTGSGMDVYEVDYEVGNVPVFPQYPPLPAGIMIQRQNLIQQIQRIVGAYAMQDGDVSQAPNTASGTTQIDEFMKRRSAHKKRKLEASLNQVAKVIGQYIPYIYTDRKMIRLISPNHFKPEEIIFNNPVEENGQIHLLNDLKTFECDVQVVSGSMLPTNRTQERAELQKMYELGIIRNPKWYLLKTDFEDIETIIAEEDALKQAQQAIQQMTEQIKQLQGALQRKSNEVIQANEKVVVNKFATTLHKAGNDVETAVQQQKNKLNAEPSKGQQQE